MVVPRKKTLGTPCDGQVSMPWLPLKPHLTDWESLPMPLHKLASRHLWSRNSTKFIAPSCASFILSKFRGRQRWISPENERRASGDSVQEMSADDKEPFENRIYWREQWRSCTLDTGIHSTNHFKRPHFSGPQMDPVGVAILLLPKSPEI